MFISRGSGQSKTANQTFKLTYMESRATHVKDRISVNNIEYPIYPGFSITIKKGSTYKVHSDDPKSYWVWSKKNIYNISSTSGSGSKAILDLNGLGKILGHLVIENNGFTDGNEAGLFKK